MSEDEAGMMGGLFTSKYLMASVFSLTNNFGIVVPIFACVFVSSDLRNGTLRNKVIAGNKRISIFMSHYISAVIYSVFIMVIYSLVNSLLSIALFEYGTEFTGEEVKSLIYIFVLGFLTFIFICSVIAFFGLIIPSTPVAIILTVAFSFILSFLSSIISFINYENYKYLVYFIPLFVNGASIQLLTVTDAMFIEGVVSVVFFSIVHIVLGIVIFNKKDLK